jgi:hypothetical protein
VGVLERIQDGERAVEDASAAASAYRLPDG